MQTIGLWLLCAVLLAVMGYAGGCSLDEIVTVDVPPNTRAHFRDNLGTAVPAEVTLRDARILRGEGDRRIKQQIETQLADHAASNTALDGEIADGTFIESLIGTAVNTGIETTLPGLGAVPGGAILTTLLAGLGMWFVPRPGTSKQEAQREKEAEDAGYDLGRSETLDAISKIRDASNR